jgi:hypothetical protein
VRLCMCHTAHMIATMAVHVAPCPCAHVMASATVQCKARPLIGVQLLLVPSL